MTYIWKSSIYGTFDLGKAECQEWIISPPLKYDDSAMIFACFYKLTAITSCFFQPLSKFFYFFFCIKYPHQFFFFRFFFLKNKLFPCEWNRKTSLSRRFIWYDNRHKWSVMCGSPVYIQLCEVKKLFLQRACWFNERDRRVPSAKRGKSKGKYHLLTQYT